VVPEQLPAEDVWIGRAVRSRGRMGVVGHLWGSREWPRVARVPGLCFPMTRFHTASLT
jgi:hypothetical protein